MQNNALKLAELKLALDDSSNKNRNFLIVFLLVQCFIGLEVLGISDLDLFLADSILSLRYFQIEVSMVVFYMTAPLVLTAFHYDLLFNLLEHTKKLDLWLSHDEIEEDSSHHLLTAFMFNTRAKYGWSTTGIISDKTVNYYLVNIIIITMVSFMPLVILSTIFWQFTKYQSLPISIWHLFLVGLNVFLQIVYWSRIQNFALLTKQYDSFFVLIRCKLSEKYLVFKNLKRYKERIAYISFAQLFFLVSKYSVGLLLIVKLWLLYSIVNFTQVWGWVVGSPFEDYLMPRLTIDRAIINSRLKPGEKLKDIPEIDFANIISKSESLKNSSKGLKVSEEQSLLFSTKLTNISENPIKVLGCDARQHYKPLDFSGRSFKWAKINGLIGCNVNMVNTALAYAQIKHSVLAGHFSLADFSHVSMVQTQFQQQSHFIETDFTNATLVNVVANESNFILANFSSAKIIASQFYLSLFQQAKFKEAEVTRSHFVFNDFKKADFSAVNFVSTDLISADLRYVDNLLYPLKFDDSHVIFGRIDENTKTDLFDNHYAEFESKSRLQNRIDEGRWQTELNTNESCELYYCPCKLKVPDDTANCDDVFESSLIQVAAYKPVIEVDLSHTTLSDIPENLIFLKTFKNVNLSNTTLKNEEVKKIFEYFPNISTLRLDSNHFHTWVHDWSGAGKLVKLTLTNATSAVERTSFPIKKESIEQLKQLKVLELFNNGINEFPREVYQLTNLEVLDMHGNKIAKLPPKEKGKANLADLKSLASINFRGNGLTNLPKGIEELDGLLTLNLGDNRLEDNLQDKWPFDMSKLVKLQSLQLDTMGIKRLPDDMSYFGALERLGLAANSLKELPKTIGELDSLQELDLAGNDLTRLPLDIARLQLLKVLNVHANPLRVLPYKVINLPNLEQLIVTGNYDLIFPRLNGVQSREAMKDWYEIPQWFCDEQAMNQSTKRPTCITWDEMKDIEHQGWFNNKAKHTEFKPMQSDGLNITAKVFNSLVYKDTSEYKPFIWASSNLRKSVRRCSEASCNKFTDDDEGYVYARIIDKVLLGRKTVKDHTDFWGWVALDDLVIELDEN